MNISVSDPNSSDIDTIFDLVAKGWVDQLDPNCTRCGGPPITYQSLSSAASIPDSVKSYLSPYPLIVDPGDTATLYWIKFWVSSEGKPGGCDNKTLNGLGLEAFGGFLDYYPLGSNQSRMAGEFILIPRR
jgi:hypothetical protein